MIKRNRTFVVKILFFFLTYYAVTILIGQNAQFSPSDEKEKYEYLEGEEVTEEVDNVNVPDDAKKVEPLQPAPESVEKELADNLQDAANKVNDLPVIDGIL